jgi:hypothetical protein
VLAKVVPSGGQSKNYVITPHTAHSYSVPISQPMTVSSHVNFTGHKSQSMTTELLNKGPVLCLAPQLIKDSTDKRGKRERNTLILELSLMFAIPKCFQYKLKEKGSHPSNTTVF